MATPIIRSYAIRYAAVADFAYVYVEEAHAADEWPLGTVESHPQPRTLEARVALAKRFLDRHCEGADQTEVSIPVCVDMMENSFSRAYAVWPERFFVLSGGKMEFISEPCNEYGFDRGQLETVLNRYLYKAQPETMEVSSAVETDMADV
eukprot:m.466003 g.466003  ORF g.466003 m.466003 type:complete len:149 (-) comp24808_c0_seq1:155-601(-)